MLTSAARRATTITPGFYKPVIAWSRSPESVITFSRIGWSPSPECAGRHRAVADHRVFAVRPARNPQQYHPSTPAA